MTKRKTVAVKVLEQQLEYVEGSIDSLRNQVFDLQAKINALMDIRENIRMNIEAHSK